MLGRQILDDLDARKRALVLESELNRLKLRVEWRQVQAATAWVSDGVRACRQASPWLLRLAPLAGFFAARTFRRSGSVSGKLLRLARWIGPLHSLWKSLAPSLEKLRPGPPR